MGKSLKGKAYGKGICQRKGGHYSARFTDWFGNRRVQAFHTLPELRNWLEDAGYAEESLVAAVCTFEGRQTA